AAQPGYPPEHVETAAKDTRPWSAKVRPANKHGWRPRPAEAAKAQRPAGGRPTRTCAVPDVDHSACHQERPSKPNPRVQAGTGSGKPLRRIRTPCLNQISARISSAGKYTQNSEGRSGLGTST